MGILNQVQRLSRIAIDDPICRCCGQLLTGYAVLDYYANDRQGIHTFPCITRHWGKHSKGINASRCREFGSRG